MLLRALIALFAISMLVGCLQQTPLSPNTTPAPAMDQGCPVDDHQLLDWLKYEHRFISSTLSDKQQLLIDAEARQPDTLYPLLLSTPGQSPQHVARALELLADRQPADSRCKADQYLQLRLRQLQQQLDTRQQLRQLELENQELKRQVDALTDLERQITRQREEH